MSRGAQRGNAAARSAVYAAARSAVYDFAPKQSQLALQVRKLCGADGSHVPVPHGDVGTLSRLERAALGIEKQLVGCPEGVRLQRCADIDGLSGTKRLSTVSARGSGARDGCP